MKEYKKHLYIEDRENMVWIPVVNVLASGKALIYGPECDNFTEEQIEKFESYCKANGFNFMITQRI